MEIKEERYDFPVSRRELSLMKEVITEFMLDFPDATDAAEFMQRIDDFYGALDL